jgi:signal transduction histidine kinase
MLTEANQLDALEMSPPTARRMSDLAQMIAAYNEVTENLRRSHEALQAEVVRLQSRLASADAQLQRSKRLAALGEMAAGIAHEVRNPLAAIGLYAAMISEDVAPLAAIAPPLAEAAGNTRKIVEAVRGLDAIVNDVLSFARDISPRKASRPARAFFSRAVAAHQAAIDAAGIGVVIGGGEVELDADADLIQQALLNLIRNAVDAMGDKAGGGTRLRALSLEAREDAGVGGRVVLTVRDTGPGISADHIDRIFNPFFTTRSTGTGLGLAIVHRIIDAHGGSIEESNDGGAVFDISLPAAAPRGHREAAS